MNFLVWYNPTTWFTEPEGIIDRTARRLFFLICEGIYGLIIKLYNLFEILCTVRLLNMDIIKSLSQRIGLILGIIMLLRVMFSFIQILIEPDTLTDKEKGAFGIVKRVLFVVIMLAVSTFAFESLFTIQKKVIENNLLGRLLLPSIPVVDGEVMLGNQQNGKAGQGKFGGYLAEELFYASYHPKEGLEEEVADSGEKDTINICEAINSNFRADIMNKGDFSLGKICLTENVTKTVVGTNGTTDDKVFVMDFNFIVALIAGIGTIYFLFMYCISVGIRMIQLMVLEIISPMAIVAYLSPSKDNMFSKWTKIYFSTYIDVFIRVAIINFAVFLISAIFGSASGTVDGLNGFMFWNQINVSTGEKGFIIIVMILAILSFAKKAPDLIKELIPASASKLGFGVQSPKQFFEDLSKSPVTSFARTAAAPVGLLAKKTIGGIDAARHGHSFFDGFGRQKGKFGSWIEKQKETLTPYGYQQHKKEVETRREGEEEVVQINKKWEAGAKIAKNLRARGVTDWKNALDGNTEANYKIVFKEDKFIKSKMHLDIVKTKKEELERQIESKRAAGTLTETDLKQYESSVKELEGAQAVHDSMRKQYQADAEREDQFKFIKGNEVNPAAPTITHQTRNIS